MAPQKSLPLQASRCRDDVKRPVTREVEEIRAELKALSQVCSVLDVEPANPWLNTRILSATRDQDRERRRNGGEPVP